MGAAKGWELARALWWATVGVFTLVFVASLRWALVVSPAPSLGVGVMAGGVWINPNYSRPSNAPLGIPGVTFAPVATGPPVKHRLMYIYRHGFNFQWRLEGPTLGSDSWSLPLWPVYAAGVGVWGVRWARRRLAWKEWQCKGCGYDLRGLAGGVCPECGRAAGGAPRERSDSGVPASS